MTLIDRIEHMKNQADLDAFFHQCSQSYNLVDGKIPTDEEITLIKVALAVSDVKAGIPPQSADRTYQFAYSIAIKI